MPTRRFGTLEEADRFIATGELPGSRDPAPVGFAVGSDTFCDNVIDRLKSFELTSAQAVRLVTAIVKAVRA